MEEPRKPDGLDVTYEGDLCLVHLRGDYDREAEAYLQYVRELLDERHGYRLTIMDVSRAGTVTHEARLALAEWNKGAGRGPGALALVGASFSVRILANMAMSAVRILTRRRTEYTFFKTHEEARAWADKERERLKAIAEQRATAKMGLGTYVEPHACIFGRGNHCRRKFQRARQRLYPRPSRGPSVPTGNA